MTLTLCHSSAHHSSTGNACWTESSTTTSQRMKRSWCSPQITYRKSPTSSRPLQRGKEGRKRLAGWGGGGIVEGQRGEKDEGAEVYGKSMKLDAGIFLRRYFLSMSKRFCFKLFCVCVCVCALPLYKGCQYSLGHHAVS